MAVIITESSVSAITDGVLAADSSKGGVLTQLFIMGAILLITVVGAKKWWYPYTIDDLERQINCVEDVIEQNTVLGRDLLGDLGWRFREQLAGWVDDLGFFVAVFLTVFVQGIPENDRNPRMGDCRTAEMELARLGEVSLAGDEEGEEVLLLGDGLEKGGCGMCLSS
ncbi:hypothetical protein PM082_022418 [Marasmius tenuissimus]|nr:hypothetical protein PM082_022418 [Marasmius tenuissimus]